MKLVKGGLLIAALSLLALSMVSPSALADPIGRPWTAQGSIRMDWGLGGAVCSAWTVAGGRNGNTITRSVFAGCTGALGTPTALVPWIIPWNAGNSGGTIVVALLANYLGLASCLYSGPVTFTYAAPTFTIGPSLVPLVSRTGGICPTNLEVRGSLVVN